MTSQTNILPIETSGRAVTYQDRRLGHILTQQGKLDAEDVTRILELQQAAGLLFGEAAMRLQLICADDLCRAIARQYDLPHLLPDNPRVVSELVVACEPFHRCAEELRALRTQLSMRWSSERRPRRMVAIVSPGPQEGRSYVAANLAVSFSQQGQRTLLIDADLRRPRQHHIFQLANRLGLSAILSGRTDHTAIESVPELGPLSVLPAGAPPPNPLELLSSNAFTDLLRDLEEQADVVLIDTAPAMNYADAHSVAFRAGRALVLAHKDHTAMTDTARLISELRDAGIINLWAVLNAFSPCRR